MTFRHLCKDVADVTSSGRLSQSRDKHRQWHGVTDGTSRRLVDDDRRRSLADIYQRRDKLMRHLTTSCAMDSSVDDDRQFVLDTLRLLTFARWRHCVVNLITLKLTEVFRTKRHRRVPKFMQIGSGILKLFWHTLYLWRKPDEIYVPLCLGQGGGNSRISATFLSTLTHDFVGTLV